MLNADSLGALRLRTLRTSCMFWVQCLIEHYFFW